MTQFFDATPPPFAIGFTPDFDDLTKSLDRFCIWLQPVLVSERLPPPKELMHNAKSRWRKLIFKVVRAYWHDMQTLLLYDSDVAKTFLDLDNTFDHRMGMYAYKGLVGLVYSDWTLSTTKPWIEQLQTQPFPDNTRYERQMDEYTWSFHFLFRHRVLMEDSWKDFCSNYDEEGFENDIISNETMRKIDIISNETMRKIINDREEEMNQHAEMERQERDAESFIQAWMNYSF